MGASLVTQAAMASQPHQKIIHATAKEKRKLTMEVSCASTPEYRFDQFILLCEECQRRKRVIETKLKEMFEKIRATSNLDQHLSAEQKHYVMSLISRYRQIQEEQNTLIEREKVRLQLMKSELGRKEESVQKIRNRLKYVIALNKDHENIITHIQQERKHFSGNNNSTITNDLRLRYRSPESDELRL